MAKSAAKPIQNGTDSHFSDNEIEPRPLSGSLLAQSSKFETPMFSNINNPNLIAGSYHSVSDISILSDNDPSDAYLPNSRKPAGNLNASNESLGNPKLLRKSNEFEYANPLTRRSTDLAHSQANLNGSSGALPINNLHQMKYNKNFYSSNNNSLSSSSSSHSPVPHSPHDFPGLKPALAYPHGPSIQPNGVQASNDSAFKVPYDFKGISDNSQSMLFGIPRNSPMPIIVPSISEELKTLTLDSPDLTKYEDPKMYTPQTFQAHARPASSEASNSLGLANGSHADIRKPILKKPTAIETTPISQNDTKKRPAGTVHVLYTVAQSEQSVHAPM